MKQKTATFTVYTPFGTSRPNVALNVMYRRKCIYSISGQDLGELVSKATVYATNQGFTAFNYSDVRGIYG